MGRTFAVGDIHGCLGKLVELMRRLPLAASDTLVFVGDYVDRGPDSRGVVEYILALQRQNDTNVVCLLGNHEQMLLDYLNDKHEELYLSNGGISTLLSYGFDRRLRVGSIPASHLRFYADLRPYHETEDYIFVHAGLRPGRTLAEQDIDDILWIRFQFINSNYDFGKTVVFGHTPLMEPYLSANKIGIDTGAVYGGRLTCVELPGRIIHQV